MRPAEATPAPTLKRYMVNNTSMEKRAMLSGIQPGKLQALDENTPQEWRFTTEAQTIYREWIEPFEREIRGDTLHLSKYRKLVLALIFGLIDLAEVNFGSDLTRQKYPNPVPVATG